MRLEVKNANHLRSAARVLGLTGIKEDLYLVADLCEQARKLLGSDPVSVQDLDDNLRTIVQSLYVTAVVTYARCFNGGARTRIEKSHVRRAAGDQADEAIKVHDIFMLTRDKHVAHAVSPYEDGILGALLRPDGSLHTVEPAVYKQTTAPHGFRQLRLLVTQLLPIVEGMIADALADARREVETMTSEELAALPDAVWVPPTPADLQSTRRDPRVLGERGAVGYQLTAEVPDDPDEQECLDRESGGRGRRVSVLVVDQAEPATWRPLGGQPSQ